MSDGAGDLDVGTLSDLLREAESAHGAFEAVTPAHSWADWYAPYLLARLHGRSPDEAVAVADTRMREEHGIVRG